VSHVLSHCFSLRRWLAAAALAALSLTGHAATLGKSSGVNATSVGNTVSIGVGGLGGGNVQTVTGGSVSVPTNDPWGWGLPAGGSTGSGTIQIPEGTANARVPVPGQPGNVIDVKVKVKPSAAALGKAIARHAVNMIPLVNTGLAIWQLFREVGIAVDTSNPAAPFKKGGDKWCTGTGSVQPYCGPTATAACNAWAAKSNEVAPQNSWTGSVTSDSLTCEIFADGQLYTRGSLTRTNTGTPTFMSEQELADEIATQSGWPSSTSIAATTKEALDKGTTIDVGTPTVSGPASSPGPTKQETTQKPDGSVETKNINTTNNYNYNNNTINVTNNVTTTVTNTPSGSSVPTSTTTTTTTQDAEEKDPCAMRPDSAACAKLGEPPDEQLPKVQKEVTWAPESIGLGGGTCPAPVGWTDHAGQHAISFQPFCDFASGTLRPIVLAFALLSAYFIVAGVTMGNE